MRKIGIVIVLVGIYLVSLGNSEKDHIIDNSGKNVANIKVFPNPGTSLNANQNVEFFNTEKKIKMSLAGLDGKEYNTDIILTTFVGDFYTAKDPLNKIPAGLYVVIETTHKDYYSQILVVE